MFNLLSILASKHQRADETAEEFKTKTLAAVLDNIYKACVQQENALIKKLDESNKELLKPYKLSAIVIKVDVDHLHPEVAGIKLKTLLNEANDAIAGHLLKFTLKSREEVSYFVDHQESQLPTQIMTLVSLVGENKSERYLQKRQRVATRPASSSFWDTGWEAESACKHFYEDISDPLMLKNLEQHVLTTGKKEIILMDVGGGKGRLAEKLIRLAQEKQIKVNYVLLEPSKAQVDIARIKLKQLKDQYKDNLRIRIFASTLEAFSTSKVFPTFKAKPSDATAPGTIDCIISSGGPLNHNVVSYEEAQANLKIMRQLLAPGGKIFAMGHTNLLVTRKDFEACNGLRMFSMSALTREETHSHIQNYVVGAPEAKF